MANSAAVFPDGTEFVAEAVLSWCWARADLFASEEIRRGRSRMRL
jgi:hypothetical protein